uniref:Uncharacterized protein n=1 Tax=Glossina pallidipes TaxID=7398 RepID=A0A1B0A793_GLOPL
MTTATNSNIGLIINNSLICNTSLTLFIRSVVRIALYISMPVLIKIITTFHQQQYCLILLMLICDGCSSWFYALRLIAIRDDEIICLTHLSHLYTHAYDNISFIKPDRVMVDLVAILKNERLATFTNEISLLNLNATMSGTLRNMNSKNSIRIPSEQTCHIQI